MVSRNTNEVRGPRRSRSGLSWWLGVLLLLGLLASPSTAFGSTANVLSGALTYAALGGEPNNVTITPNGGGGNVTVTDSGATITPLLGCTTVDTNTVNCNSVTSITVTANDLADTVTVNVAIVSTLNGDAGADTLTGGTLGDTVSGGSEDDTLDGGTGPDALNGGLGTDTVSYATRSATVTADIDGVADDGEASEGDNIGVDVENLTGGSGADTLPEARAPTPSTGTAPVTRSTAARAPTS